MIPPSNSSHDIDPTFPGSPLQESAPLTLDPTLPPGDDIGNIDDLPTEHAFKSDADEQDGLETLLQVGREYSRSPSVSSQIVSLS
jgi:hypothetical protein